MNAVVQFKPPQTPPSYADLDLAWRESCWRFIAAIFAGAKKEILDELRNEMYRARQARGVERG